MHILPTRRAIARTLVAVAGLAGATMVSAQTIDVTGTQRSGAETKTMQVGFSDLDLARDQDRDRLDRRIRWAAGAVCGANPIKGLERRNDHAACTIAAIDGAQHAVRAAVQTAAAGGDD